MQRKGRVTAQELARDLEVSVRTIYRDWYGLRVAGVPLITDAGPGGGARLYGDWRTELTGLTAGEYEALSLLTTTESASLGSGRLISALAKLSAAIPAELRLPEGRVYIDPAAGDTLLEVLNRAVHADVCVDLVLTRLFDSRIERRVQPLGLVSQAERWHLVWTQADRRVRVDQVNAIASAKLTTTSFERPADFELTAFWQSYAKAATVGRRNFVAEASAAESVIPLLRRQFGNELSVSGTRLVFRFDDIIQARSALLPWGGAVEVTAPEALRRTLIDFAEQTLARHRESVSG